MATSRNNRDVTLKIGTEVDTDDLSELKTELDKAAAATLALGKAADTANADASAAKKARAEQSEALARLRLEYREGKVDAEAFKTQEIALQRAVLDAGVAVRATTEVRKAANVAVQAASAHEKQLAEQLRQATAATRQQGEAARTLTGDLQGVGQQLRTIQRLAGAAIGGQLLGGVLGDVAKAADAFANFSARIKLVAGDGADLAAVMQGIFDIAQRTGAPLDVVAELFTKLATAGKQLGVTNQQTLGLVESITQATALSGGTAESAAAAITQFSQAMSAGALRGEEFNSIMEQAPRLARALADALGITTGELRKQAEAGALTSQVVINALQGQAATLRAEFEQLPPTIGRAITGLSNAWTQYVGAVDKASGASAAIASAINALSRNLDTVANILFSLGKAAAAFQALRMAQTLLGIGAAATTAAAGVTALSTAQATATVGAGRFATALAGIKAFTLVGIVTNFREIGTAIGEGIAKLQGYGKVLEEAERRQKAEDAATRAAAEAKARLAQQTQLAADKALELGRESQALIGIFNKARENGDTTADALSKVARALDLSNTDGIKAAISALDALAVRGQITGAQLKDALSGALKDADLGKFATEAQLAFEKGWIGARRLAAAVDALGDESLRRAGLGAQELSTGFGAASASAINDVDALVKTLDRLGAKGPETGAALARSLDKATEAANTERALRAVIERIEELGRAGRLSGDQVADALEKARAKIDSLVPGVTSLDEALRNFGLKSKAELEQTAKLYADSWDAIKNSTIVALDAKIEAFEKYAAAATAANMGVEKSEVSLQREILRTQQAAQQTMRTLGSSSAPLQSPGPQREQRQAQSGGFDQAAQNRRDGYLPNVHTIDHNGDRVRSTLTPNDLTAVDNRLQFAIRDKLQAGLLTGADLPDLLAVIESLKQQAAVNNSASRLSAGFQSNVGAADALQWQQVRVRLEDIAKQLAPAGDLQRRLAGGPATVRDGKGGSRTINITMAGQTSQLDVASDRDADVLEGVFRRLEESKRLRR